jgi:hypothetical protein
VDDVVMEIPYIRWKHSFFSGLRGNGIIRKTSAETVDTLRAEIVVEMEDERVHEIEDGILDEIAADGGLGRSHHYVPDLSLQAVLDHIRVAAETIITNRHSRASSRGEAAAAVAVIAAVVDPTFREL